MSEKDTIPKGQLWVKKRGQLSVPKGNILEVEGTLVVEPETDVEKFGRKYGVEVVVQDDKTSHPQSRWSTAKKLQWLGSNRQLICLYEQLVTRELIERTDNWPSLLSAHFLNKDGKNFNPSNLSKQNYQLYDAKSPRGFKVVDKVLNEVDREAAKNEKD